MGSSKRTLDISTRNRRGKSHPKQLNSNWFLCISTYSLAFNLPHRKQYLFRQHRPLAENIQTPWHHHPHLEAPSLTAVKSGPHLLIFLGLRRVAVTERRWPPSSKTLLDRWRVGNLLQAHARRISSALEYHYRRPRAYHLVAWVR